MARQGRSIASPAFERTAPTSAACVSFSLAHVAPLVSSLPVLLLWLPLKKSPRSRGHRGAVLHLPSLDDLGGGDHLLGGHNHRESPPFICSSPAVLRETGSLMQSARPVALKNMECLGHSALIQGGKASG